MGDTYLDKRILLTGATGFVGTYLAERLLDDGANVTVIVRDYRPDSCFIDQDIFQECNVIHGDLTDRALIERVLAEYEIQRVFHLAAQTVVSIANTAPYQTLQNNLMTTLGLLEAIRINGKVEHTVIASSDKAYGELSKRRKYVESDPVQGLHPYDCSKSCTDLIAQTYLTTYGLPLAITRCGNIYGGGDMNWSRLIPNTIRRLLRGNIPVIHGTGEETRDYFYVEDTVSAYMLLGQKQATGAYNFSTGTELTVKTVIEQICEVMGLPARYDTLNHSDAEISYQWLDSSKARKNLGWHPRYSFAEGLRRTADWYRKRLAGS